MTTVDVAIINWNTAQDAVAAANAYANSRDVDARVTIFDNASDPEQRAVLREVDPSVKVTFGEENLGYGRAANRTLAHGVGEFVLVSNADITPEPDAVKAMAFAFESDPNCGLVGPILTGAPGYHDKLPGPITLLIRVLIAGFGRKGVEDPGPGAVAKVSQPAGACLLTSRTVWEEVGGFDERFFLWYEDVDLAKRIEGLGRHNLVAGDARATHIGGKAFLALDFNSKDRLRIASLRIYAGRHHPTTARLIALISPFALTARRVVRGLTDRMARDR